MAAVTRTMKSCTFRLRRCTCNLQQKWSIHGQFSNHSLLRHDFEVLRERKLYNSRDAKIRGKSTVENGTKSDVGLNSVQLIEKHGFICETHYILTEDNYILTYHRIPPTSNSKKPSVLLMHGLLSSSADFVNHGNNSLAFILSKEGYDVWLGNARGNDWSRNHKILDLKNDTKKFFDFSWHEIGYYDLANSVDYILNLKNEESLLYVGYSQGTTAFMVLTSTRPEYNKKIKIAHLLAPAGLMACCPNQILVRLSKHIIQLEKTLIQMKIYEIPYVEAIKNVGLQVLTGQQLYFLCNILFNLVPIMSLKEIDKDFIRVLITNFPSNAAIKQVIHYAQLIQNGRFAQYDYGPSKNMKKYGSEQPPLYDLGKITTPVAFYYSDNDGLIAVEDTKQIISRVPNVVLDYLVPRPSFQHVDFLFARDVVTLIYDKLLKSCNL